MVIDFPVTKGVYGQYCPVCHTKNTASEIRENGRKMFVCSNCNTQSDRLVIIDPKIRWWVDDEKVYYHESAGIFLVNPTGKLLFFELTKFPYGLTAPAGHVDINETALEAVIRETEEEVGVKIANPRLVTEVMIHGDSCSRGCDDHKWSLFTKSITQKEADSIKIDGREGQKPRWVQISEVDSLKVPYAMRFLFDNYRNDIENALIAGGLS